MTVKALFLVAILCTAVAFAAGLAHAMSLPHKIDLSRENYLRAQQLYAGWALLGIAIVIALIANAMLAFLLKSGTGAFYATLAAVACIVLGLAVFFVFTFPANRATQNWTVLPDDWQALRTRWEYSHLCAAVLYAGALAAEVLAVLGLRRE